MLRKISDFFILIIVFIFFSCQKNEIKPIIFESNFDSISPFLKTNQIKDSTRYRIINEENISGNSYLQMDLLPMDFNAGGKRNELTFLGVDSTGYSIEYSFKFMLTESFFKERKEKDWVMIHQWHDEPPKGILWVEYKRGTRPPIGLYLSLRKDGGCILSYDYGIEDEIIKNKQYLIYPQKMEPNVWYTFSNEVLWSIDEKGYSIPKLNGKSGFYNGTREIKQKLSGINMYNTVPNYYKMGLYGNNKRSDSLYIFFDDFTYISYCTLKPSYD